MNEKPRVMTTEEVREEFLDAIRARVMRWDGVAGKSQRERLEGLAFSILVILDGEAGDMPGFSVVPSPHADDAKYLSENGDNWFPSTGDIAGDLHHELWREQR